MKITFGICFIILGLFLASCGTANVIRSGMGGMTSVVWDKGKANTTFTADLDSTWNGVTAAAKSLQMTETSSQGTDPMERRFLGNTISGDTVNIQLKAKSRTETEVTVLVNVLGDRDLSGRIIDEISHKMGIPKQ